MVDPVTGLYEIDVAGAAGGTGGAATPENFGDGAYIRGEVRLSAGTVLTILAGGMGQEGLNQGAGGGGGGSFVFEPNIVPLVIAGGGGGGNWVSPIAGGPGQTGTTGGGPGGGVNGSGGAGKYYSNGGGGGGGGGLFGNGADGFARHIDPGYGGKTAPSFLGGLGGYYAGPAIQNGYKYTGAGGGSGGFGGGGGGGYVGGGGGGGFSGGAAGYGGGSYISRDVQNPVALIGANTSSGYVDINLLSAVPEPKVWVFLMTGLGFLGYCLRRRLRAMHQ